MDAALVEPDTGRWLQLPGPCGLVSCFAESYDQCPHDGADDLFDTRAEGPHRGTKTETVMKTIGTKWTTARAERCAAAILAVGVALAAPAAPALASGGSTTGADVQISGSASTGSPSPGAPFTYTFLVKNAGPDTATATTLTQTLPPGFYFDAGVINGTAACDATSGASGDTVVTCLLGDVAKSAQDTVSINVDAPSTVGTYSTTTTTNSTAVDPNTANNQVTITVGVLTSNSTGGGGGGGGGSTTSTGTICGMFTPAVTGYTGYYGFDGIRVGGGFLNCGTFHGEVIDVYFTDTTPDPACAITVPPLGSKLLNPGSTQTILGATSSSLSSSCTTAMVLSHTFLVDVVAENVDQGSFLWTTNI